jgi:hypothetical protein
MILARKAGFGTGIGVGLIGLVLAPDFDLMAVGRTSSSMSSQLKSMGSSWLNPALAAVRGDNRALASCFGWASVCSPASTSNTFAGEEEAGGLDGARVGICRRGGRSKLKKSNPDPIPPFPLASSGVTRACFGGVALDDIVMRAGFVFAFFAGLVTSITSTPSSP